MRLGFEVGLELDGRIMVHRNTEGSRDWGYFFEVGLELDGRIVYIQTLQGLGIGVRF